MMGPTHKVYKNAARVQLPKRLRKSARSFDETLLSRRSLRDFSGEKLPFAAAAKLLHLTNGVTGTLDTGDPYLHHLRTAPSGGALYPVELYVLAQKVAGLKPGIYHYNPVESCLEEVSLGNPFAELMRVTHVDELKQASMAVALTGVSVKNRVKYGERGYRFMLFEAGHIAQNFLLAANAMKLPAFTIGGFVDDELDRLLKIADFDEASLYVAAVGMPAKKKKKG
jgi:SagB-type dehydrogenase family enzyme